MARTARTSRAATAGEVGARYFEAVARRDVDGMLACWAPGGVDNFVGQLELAAPEGVRDYFDALFAAFPDLGFEVLELLEHEDRCVVRWRATGTFAGARFQDLEPTGARIAIEGCDCLVVEDGRIARNDAYFDSADMARQLGAMPPRDSSAEQRLLGAVNARTRLMRRMVGEPERVADGVWVVRGGFPLKTMNVYLIEGTGGVTVFDAGIRAMTNGVAAAAARFGGVERLVLGHSHADHRGCAPGLGVPVLCHEHERGDAEGDGGDHYFHLDRLRFPGKYVFAALLASWDGGPTPIAETVAEGDEVAGFRVVHLPGHAPGLIGLWREDDRLALVSDCFYTLDPQTTRPGPPRVPHEAFNQSTEQARESIRKLAAMEPAAAWPGHADPVLGDVRSKLEHAAAST